MTLRQRLGLDVQRIYEQVDDLLDSEDAIIILADAHRAIHYARGFGLSACQHELLPLLLTRPPPSSRRCRRREQHEPAQMASGAVRADACRLRHRRPAGLSRHSSIALN